MLSPDIIQGWARSTTRSPGSAPPCCPVAPVTRTARTATCAAETPAVTKHTMISGKSLGEFSPPLSIHDLSHNIHEAVWLTINAKNGGRVGDAVLEVGVATRMARMSWVMRWVNSGRHHTACSNIQLPPSLPRNLVIQACRHLKQPVDF